MSRIGEFVFVKVSGWQRWPCRILDAPGSCADKFLVEFLATQERALVHPFQMTIISSSTIKQYGKPNQKTTAKRFGKRFKLAISMVKSVLRTQEPEMSEEGEEGVLGEVEALDHESMTLENAMELEWDEGADEKVLEVQEETALVEGALQPVQKAIGITDVVVQLYEQLNDKSKEKDVKPTEHAEKELRGAAEIHVSKTDKKVAEVVAAVQQEKKQAESVERLGERALALTGQTMIDMEVEERMVGIKEKALEIHEGEIDGELALETNTSQEDTAMDLEEKAIDLEEKAVDLEEKAVDLEEKAVDLEKKEGEVKQQAVAKKVTEVEKREEEVAMKVAAEKKVTETGKIAVEMKKAAEFEKKSVQLEEKVAAVEMKAADVDRKAAEVDRKAAEVDRRAAEVNRRAAEVDRRAAEVDRRAAQVEKKVAEVKRKAAEVDKKAEELEGKVAEVDRKAAGEDEDRERALQEGGTMDIEVEEYALEGDEDGRGLAQAENDGNVMEHEDKGLFKSYSKNRRSNKKNRKGVGGRPLGSGMVPLCAPVNGCWHCPAVDCNVVCPSNGNYHYHFKRFHPHLIHTVAQK